MLKGVLFAAIGLCGALAASADLYAQQTYFWRDANGRPNYSDLCPGGFACQVRGSSAASASSPSSSAAGSVGSRASRFDRPASGGGALNSGAASGAFATAPAPSSSGGTPPPPAPVPTPPPASSSPPPPPPPPPKKPCECDSLEVELRNFGGGTHINDFDLAWTLACTRGSGRTCKGTLTAGLSTASERAGVLLRDLITGQGDPRPGVGGTLIVDCKGRCIFRKTSGFARLSLEAPWRKKVLFGPQGIGSVTLEVERFCKRELTTKIFRIAFNPGGFISKRRSDLNGNGVADGKEKKG